MDLEINSDSQLLDSNYSSNDSSYFLSINLNLDLVDHADICNDIDNDSSLAVMEFKSSQEPDQDHSFILDDTELNSPDSNLSISDHDHFDLNENVYGKAEHDRSCSIDSDDDIRDDNGGSSGRYNLSEQVKFNTSKDYFEYGSDADDEHSNSEAETNSFFNIATKLTEKSGESLQFHTHVETCRYVGDDFNNDKINDCKKVDYNQSFETFYSSVDVIKENGNGNGINCLLVAAQAVSNIPKDTIDPKSIHSDNLKNDFYIQNYELPKIDVTPINFTYPVSNEEEEDDEKNKKKDEDRNDEDYVFDTKIDYSFSFDEENDYYHGDNANNGDDNEADEKDDVEYIENIKANKKQRIEENSKESGDIDTNSNNEPRVRGTYEKARRGQIEQPKSQTSRVHNYILITNLINLKTRKQIEFQIDHHLIFNLILKDAIISKTVEKYGKLFQMHIDVNLIKFEKLQGYEIDEISKFEVIEENKWKLEYFIHNLSNNCNNISKFKEFFDIKEYSNEWVYYENKFDQPMFQIGNGKLPLRFCNQLGNFYEPFILRERRKDKYLMKNGECFKRFKRHLQIENFTSFDDNSYEVEAMCPYCPINTEELSMNVTNLNNYFFGRNNSEYLHHITKHHGIYSNGNEQKLPLFVIKDHNKKYKAYCQDCKRLIRIKSLENNALSCSSNKFLTFLRHSVSHDCEDLELLKFLKKHKAVIESNNTEYGEIQEFIDANYSDVHNHNKTQSKRKNGSGISRRGRNTTLLQDSSGVKLLYEQEYDMFQLQNRL